MDMFLIPILFPSCLLPCKNQVKADNEDEALPALPHATSLLATSLAVSFAKRFFDVRTFLHIFFESIPRATAHKEQGYAEFDYFFLSCLHEILTYRSSGSSCFRSVTLAAETSASFMPSGAAFHDGTDKK